MQVYSNREESLMLNLRQKIVIALRLLVKYWWLRSKNDLRDLRKKGFEGLKTPDRPKTQVSVPVGFEGVKKLFVPFFVAVNAGIFLMIITMLIGALFYVGGRPELANPALRDAVPTIAPTSTPEPKKIRAIDVFDWLSQEEARELREKESVVNWAVLKNGGSKYSSLGITFNIEGSTWARTKPFIIEAASPEGTAVTFEVEGKIYNLNLLQPFTVESRPEKVFLFDTSGRLWEAMLSEVQFREVSVVQQELNTIILPNPNLSLSY